MEATKDEKQTTKDERRKTKDERVEKVFREKPVRKGRKPFVPPSGRNAGKVLGGSFLGRKRLEREQTGGAAPHEDAETVRREIRANHPLGDAAQGDD